MREESGFRWGLGNVGCSVLPCATWPQLDKPAMLVAKLGMRVRAMNWPGSVERFCHSPPPPLPLLVLLLILLILLLLPLLIFTCTAKGLVHTIDADGEDCVLCGLCLHAGLGPAGLDGEPIQPRAG